jgi:hypothetical protein
MGHHPPRYEPGRRTRANAYGGPLVTHPHNRKDNPMNDPTAKTTAEWPGIAEEADFLNFRIGAWHDFGYVTPPTQDCKQIPPLGERSTEAIKAGHGAIEMIDEIVRELYQVREQLADELRADEDIRAARVDAMLAEGHARREAETASAAPRCGSPATCAEFGHEHSHIDDAVPLPDPPEPAPLIHMEKSASATACGLPTYKPPIHLGVLTVDTTKVTCPDCQPKKYWHDPDAAAGVDSLTTTATRIGRPEPTAAERPHQLSARGALKDELGRSRRSREAWEETARACVCPPGVCTRGEFRDHAGESEGCMVCADLDPDQPCYAAVVRALRPREEGGR